MSATLATTTSVGAQLATLTGPPPREAANAGTPLPPSQGSSQQTAQSSAVPAKAPASVAAVGFTLAFDADTQRLILEARDPVSGFVIYQIPPKSALKQLSPSASAAPSRGAKVDSAV